MTEANSVQKKNQWTFIPVDSNQHSSFNVESKSLIGRQTESSTADVMLDSPMVSREHCQIEIIDGQKAIIKDLGSSNGTFVNKKKISETEIFDQDIIYIDKIGFTVISPEEKDAEKTALRNTISNEKTALRKTVSENNDKSKINSTNQDKTQFFVALKAELIKLKGSDDIPESINITKLESILGRSEECDIQINDNTVSKKHTLIKVSDGKIYIKDIGSTNGTKVNKKTIKDLYELNNNDRIKMGKTEFRFKTDTDNSSTQYTETTQTVNSKKHQTSKTKLYPENTTGFMQKIPVWIFGLSGIVIALIAGISFMVFKPVSSPAQLQMTSKWTRVLPQGRKNPTTPALGDINGDNFPDAVYADALGYITALDGAEGKQIMTTGVASKIIAPPVLCDLNGDGSQDIIIGSLNGIVTAIDGTGKILWQTTEKYDLGRIVNRPVIHDVNGDGQPDIIVPTYNKGIVALDGERGWKIWDTEEFFNEKIVTSPVIDDLNNDGVINIAALSASGELIAFTPDKNRIWKMWENREVGNIFYASPVTIKYNKNKAIVTATDKAGVSAYNAKTGRMLWENDKITDSFYASPAVADINNDNVDDILLISENNKMYLLDGKYGELIWQMDIESQVKATPIFFNVNNTNEPEIIIADTNGSIKIFDSFRGHLLEKYKSNQIKSYNSSTVIADIDKDNFAEIIAGSEEGKLIAVGVNAKTKSGEIIWPFFLGNNSHKANK